MSHGERCADEHCVTCGDVAEPMEVLEVEDAAGLATCAGADGERRTIETALVAPVAAGETLLVHAGTAIAREPAPAAPGRGSSIKSPRRSRGQGIQAGAEEAA